MATTPNGFPYPVGTDKVVDGDDAIRNLAQTIDPRLPPAVDEPVTYNANYGPLANQPLKLTLYGKRLTIAGAIRNIVGPIGWNAFSYLAFGTVPAAIRPATGTTYVVNGVYLIAGVGFFVSQLTIAETGVINWQASQTQASTVAIGALNAYFFGEVILP
jgi:hypothetical protein